MTKTLVGGGKGWERELVAMLRAVPGGYVHRHEPKMAGKIRVSGGLPDFEIILHGRVHLVEAKAETGTAASLGRLVGIDRDCGTGVKPSQAAEMDAATRAGASCWIAVRLEVPAAGKRKADVVQALVPWHVWRGRMEHAEQERIHGRDPKASIPAAVLWTAGRPLRTVADLVAALEGV